MTGHDPQYDEEIDTYLGQKIRVNKLDDGTIISHVYECKACGGMGGNDWSRDCEVYDDWHSCGICEGSGEIEVD